MKLAGNTIFITGGTSGIGRALEEAFIISNSSVVAYIPMAMAALYPASKAAIHSYSLSQRFALRETSVRVLEIAPPWVDTDLVHRSGDPRAMQVEPFIAEQPATWRAEPAAANRAARNTPGMNSKTGESRYGSTCGTSR